MNLFFVFKKEGRADAVPTTRNYTPDSPDLDERRGQPLRSAMARSRPGGTALMITVTSAPSKFKHKLENCLLYLACTNHTARHTFPLTPLRLRKENTPRLSFSTVPYTSALQNADFKTKENEGNESSAGRGKNQKRYQTTYYTTTTTS